MDRWLSCWLCVLLKLTYFIAFPFSFSMALSKLGATRNDTFQAPHNQIVWFYCPLVCSNPNPPSTSTQALLTFQHGHHQNLELKYTMSFSLWNLLLGLPNSDDSARIISLFSSLVLGDARYVFCLFLPLNPSQSLYGGLPFFFGSPFFLGLPFPFFFKLWNHCFCSFHYNLLSHCI